MRPVEITTDDGFMLSGTLHGEPGGARAALLIAPAMGVPQRYYADFARWMAAQGRAVLTFDYRGMGESRPAGASLREVDVDLFDWAADTDTVIEALAERAGGLPIVHTVQLLDWMAGGPAPAGIAAKPRAVAPEPVPAE